MGTCGPSYGDCQHWKRFDLHPDNGTALVSTTVSHPLARIYTLYSAVFIALYLLSATLASVATRGIARFQTAFVCLMLL